MVLQVPRQPGFSSPPRAQEPPIAPHRRQHEPRGARCRVHVVRALEYPSRPGEGADHEPVPARDHLVVPSRRRTLEALEEQARPRAIHPRAQFALGDLLRERQLRPRALPVNDVPGLLAGHGIHEIPGLLDPVDAREQRSLFGTEHIGDFLQRPEVGCAFASFGVRVERGIEPALLGGHLPHDPGERLLGGAAMLRIPPARERFGVHRSELRVVVEHLLEVRDEPARVGRVAMEPSSDVIADAPHRHAVERSAHDALEILAGRCRRRVQEQLQRAMRRELGRAAEAAVVTVVRGDKLLDRALPHGPVDRPGGDELSPALHLPER